MAAAGDLASAGSDLAPGGDLASVGDLAACYPMGHLCNPASGPSCCYQGNLGTCGASAAGLTTCCMVAGTGQRVGCASNADCCKLSNFNTYCSTSTGYCCWRDNSNVEHC